MEQYIKEEPACFDVVLKNLKPNSEKYKAQFALAYLYFLEQKGITDVVVIRSMIQSLSNQRNASNEYTQKNDFFYIKKKNYYIHDDDSFVVYKIALLQAAGTPVSFKTLLKHFDNNCSACNACVFSSEAVMQSDKEHELLRCIVKSESFVSLFADYQLTDLFKSYVPLSQYVVTLQQEIFFPVYRCLANAISKKDDSYLRGFFKHQFNIIQEVFEEELKKYGITADTCHSASYSLDIYKAVINPMLVSDESCDLESVLSEIVNYKKKSSLLFDIDVVPPYSIEEEKKKQEPELKTLETQHMDSVLNKKIDESSNSVKMIADKQKVETDSSIDESKIIDMPAAYTFHPYILSKEIMQSVTIVGQQSNLLDRIVSHSENDGFCIVEACRNFDNSDVLIVYLKEKFYALSLSDVIIKRVFMNKKFEIVSYSPYAIYSMALAHRFNLRPCVLPLYELLKSKNIVPQLCDNVISNLSNLFHYISKDELSDLTKISDENTKIKNITQAYGYSFYRVRFFRPDEKTDALLCFNNGTRFCDFKVGYRSVRCDGFVLMYEIFSDEDKNTSYAALIESVIFDLVEQGDFRLREIVILERKRNSISFFCRDYCFNYFSTNIMNLFFRKGRSMGIKNIHINFSKVAITPDKRLEKKD